MRCGYLPLSSRRSKELQSNVVWVTERQSRSVRRIDDSAVGDAKLVQMALPFLELGPVGASESQMIQAGATLVERLGALQVGELVDGDERPSHEPDHVVEGAGVFVDDGIGAEKLLVPGPAASEVADGQRHVCDRRKLRHHALHSWVVPGQ